MFDWVLNKRLREVLQNSCYQKSFTKSFKDACEEFSLLSFSCESNFIQIYSSKILLFPGILYNPILGKHLFGGIPHLLITAALYSWFINVSTTLFLELTKHSYRMKKLIHRIIERQLRVCKF